MAKRRDKITMSQDEMWAFVDQQKSLQVATLNKDGSVHLSTLWYAVSDESIIFETYTKSQKILNLQRDPRICLLLEDGITYPTLRGVTVNANAELYSNPEEVEPLAAKVLARNNPEWDEATAQGAAKHLASKRTAVVAKLTAKTSKVISWDHTKLDGVY